ncbi:MAG: sigma-70 family RNA polymerase sigma factor [Cyanobacteria bacterium P01_A01_bin.84]
MQQRQTIIEIFSTFLQFDAEYFRGWSTDTRLRRSMESCLKKSVDNIKFLDESDTQENFWALYWYKIWQCKTARIAKEHLSAYLQETCYWVAKKSTDSFASNQYKISDCFQIAIANVDKVLQSFNHHQSSALKSYAGMVFHSTIRDTLRQRHEIDICSAWGLLRKVSQKRLSESLNTVGLGNDDVKAYITVWNCFKIHYVPNPGNSGRQLPKPDKETLEKITAAYNSQSSSKEIPATIEKWLLESSKAIRQYLYPSITSINAPAGNDSSTEWLDNLPDNSQDSLLTELIQEEEKLERKSQQSEVSQVLMSAINKLETQAREILQLYYAQGFTQQQIASSLEIKQYTISRRLTKSKELLLKSLAKWSQERLHIPITSDVLKNSSDVIEEWLQIYYQS